jgi:hypothetical protein
MPHSISSKTISRLLLRRRSPERSLSELREIVETKGKQRCEKPNGAP